MKKHEIRKKYFKLKEEGHTNNQCRKILLAKYYYEVDIRTLRRWTQKLKTETWDLMDKSRKPKTIYRKISKETENKIIKIRNKTGWGENKIADFVDVSSWSVNKILREHKLTEPSKRKKKRIKYVRF